MPSVGNLGASDYDRDVVTLTQSRATFVIGQLNRQLFEYLIHKIRLATLDKLLLTSDFHVTRPTFLG